MNATGGQAGGRRRDGAARHEVRIWLGAYVLGALDAAESRQVRSHLMECGQCREEYGGLLDVRAVLDRAWAAAVPGPRPAPDALPTAAAWRTGRGPTLRRRLGLVAGVVLLASGVGVGGALWAGGHSGTSPGTRAVAATGPYGMAASIRFHPESWGTAIRVTMSNIPAGYTCTLTAVGKDGRVEAAATWSSGPRGGTVTVPGSVAMPAASIDHFEVAIPPGIDLVVPAG